MYADVEDELKGRGKISSKKQKSEGSTMSASSSPSSKKSIEQDRQKLKELLNQPWQIDSSQSINPNIRRKRQLIVVAK